MHAGHSIGYGTVDCSELATVRVQILQTTIQLLVYWHQLLLTTASNSLLPVT